MIDIKSIVDKKMNKDYISSCNKRGIDPQIETISNLNEKIKDNKSKINNLRERINIISQEFPKVKSDKEKIILLKEESKNNSIEINRLNFEVSVFEKSLKDILLNIPNTLDNKVPYGESENDNEVFFSIPPVRENIIYKNHYELSSMLDFERGVKISGPRNTIIRGDLARLYRALGQYLIGYNSNNGYEEHIVPTIVKDETMLNADKLPKFINDAYQDIDGSFFIPTGEVPLVTQYSNEIVDLNNPIRMTTLSSCFRKEAGSAGRDTRGLIRHHQFDKVELVTICKPEESRIEHMNMINHICSLLDTLEMEYRKVLLCSKDTGFGASKTIDIEVFFHGANEYREISSCSTCSDFQSRRSNIRYKDVDGKNKFPHTLNGSSLPVGRLLAAIMEKYQLEDNLLSIPKVLRDKMNCELISL